MTLVGGKKNQGVGDGNREDFPVFPRKILLVPVIGTMLLGCQQASVSANSKSINNSSPPPAPVSLVAPAGSVLRVRLDQALDTSRSRSGDRFSGELDSPVFANGRQVLAKGTIVHGHVVNAHPSGRFKGRAILSLTLDSCDFHGREIGLSVTSVTRVSDRHRKRNWTWIGGTSGTGALVGGLVAGPIGMLAGAGSGAAVGTVGAVVTGKKQVHMPAESLAGFTLRNPLVI